MTLIESIPHDDAPRKIVELRLARPPVNALNPELCRAITDSVGQAVSGGAEGLMLTSSPREGGTAVFSAGIDVPHLLSLNDDRIALHSAWDAFMQAARTLAASPVPVAVGIAGHAPAGGCVLALCCDWRVMARSNDAKPYRIGLNETQVGLAVPAGIQHLLRRIVGARIAERMLVAGEMPTSEQALALGIVDELADLEDVTAQAKAWLQRTLALPREAVQRTRALARADLQSALSPANLSLDAFIDDWYSPGTQHALQALAARLGR